jgi:long-chain acyl-CoA synthetase
MATRSPFGPASWRIDDAVTRREDEDEVRGKPDDMPGTGSSPDADPGEPPVAPADSVEPGDSDGPGGPGGWGESSGPVGPGERVERAGQPGEGPGQPGQAGEGPGQAGQPGQAGEGPGHQPGEPGQPGGPGDGAAADAYARRPWLASYSPGVPADVEVADVTLVDLLDRAADAHPEAPAVSFFGATLTFAELRDHVDALAAELRRLGVAAADRVALILPDCPQHVTAFFAVLRLGAVVVELNPVYTTPELTQALADCGAELAVCVDRVFGEVDAVRHSGATRLREVVVTSLADGLPARDRVTLHLPGKAARRRRRQLRTHLPPGARAHRFTSLVRLGRISSHREPVRPEPAREPGPASPGAGSPTAPGAGAGVPASPGAPSSPGARPSPGDVAVLVYTTGTTGPAKGAMLTHRGLVSNAVQCRAWMPDLVEAGEALLCVLPLFHAYGLTLCLSFGMLLAAHLVLVPRFDPDLVFAAARRHRPTIFPGVPPVFRALVSDPRARAGGLASVRVSICGAMRMPPRLAGQWPTVTSGPLVEGYGLTEASPVTHCNPIGVPSRPGWVGLPLPSTECRVVDPDDSSRAVPVGETGELAVRGPQLFAGYWNDPASTRAVETADGWLLTGDVARMDAGGWFQIVGRLKDVVVVGGFNVYPAEVEEVLASIPQVAEVAVVGAPDPFRGETLRAVIVLRAGERLTADEVQAYAAGSLAPYKIPRIVEFRSEPLSRDPGVGKLRRPSPRRGGP